MDAQFREYLILHTAAQAKALSALLDLVATPRPTKDQRNLASQAIDELSQIKPPPAPERGPGPEGRKKIGEAVRNAWAGKREQMKLHFFEWAGEDPRRVDYDEASKLLGYAAHTLRVRISASPSRSIALWRGGKWLVLAKTPDGLQPALDSKFAETQNPDDQRQLTKRAKPR